MKALPHHVALSIRQPWAWLIVNGYKDIENRSRNIGSYTGPVLIHAGATMTRDDYEACQIFVSSFSELKLPLFADLPRGGIVGATNILGLSMGFDVDYFGPWHLGPVAYHLQSSHSHALPFAPCKGALGFFRVPASVVKGKTAE